MVLGFLNDGMDLVALNDTFLALISKVSSVDRITKSRPISLFKIAYKLISKVLSNRLCRFLSEVVDESESAFISDRLTIDNAIFKNEAIHSMKKRGPFLKQGCMELYMMKAYDRVEWVI